MNASPSRDEHLFAEALARPEQERAAFLDGACRGDVALRERIIGLLSAHAGPDSLNPPPVTRATLDSAIEKPGDRIDRYTLIENIGEGGCGVVYRAEQEKPVRRSVALKVIKAGMDTREVIARFGAERQALAMMDHPGIAKVLDAGATTTGRPYFVMELVRGTPITKFCDAQNLSSTARLALFMDVCHAVQHAHQKGIIHRDLKPSNILVARPAPGAKATPKVIDFGIAKAMQGRLTDATLATAIDQFIGTPAYMSPEQAGAHAADVDTRSDVYSLGVLLYELLVGHPPFDPHKLRQSSRDEIRRIIREVEPLKPSTQFSMFVVSVRTAVATTRATDPGELSQALARDLDWIVMKAIEKDRNRRYASAAAFADDIARYLNHEPVLARPPSTAYRFAKLIRRNRLLFAAAAAICVTLVAAAAVSTWQAAQAREARRIAQADRRKALDERARAEELLAFMLGDLRGPLKRIGELGLLERVGRQALDYFAGQDVRELSDTVLAQHAKALLLVGQLRLDQARYDEARRSFEAAYMRAATLARRNPRDVEMRLAQAEAQGWVGLVLRRAGRLDEAGGWFEQQRMTAQQLLAAEPHNPRWQRALAEADHSLGAVAVDQARFDDARARFVSELGLIERLSEAAPKDRELQQQWGDVLSFLATIAEKKGELVEARRLYGLQAAKLEEVSREDPAVALWRFKHAESLVTQAALLAVTGQMPLARENIRRARPALEQLVAEDRVNRRWRASLMNVRLHEAALAKAANEPVAGSLAAEAATGLAELSAAEPSDRRLQLLLVHAWRLQADSDDPANQPHALTAANRAVELGEKLIAAEQATLREIVEWAHAMIAAGHHAQRAGDDTQARQRWERVRATLATHVQGSRDWRLLDPAARAALLLGAAEEADGLIAQLTSFGYVPCFPWPARNFRTP